MHRLLLIVKAAQLAAEYALARGQSVCSLIADYLLHLYIQNILAAYPALATTRAYSQALG